MSDDPNDASEDLGEPEADEDLDAAQLEAAAAGAEHDIETDTEPAMEDEPEEAAEDESLGEDDTVVLGAAGARAGVGAPVPNRLSTEARGPRVRAPKTTRTAFAIDPALRIQDPWSAAFVIVSVLVFAVILAYALLFGHGGAFTPLPTPTPVSSEVPSAAPSASPSAAPSASPTVAPSISPSIAPSSAPSTAPSPTSS